MAKESFGNPAEPGSLGLAGLLSLGIDESKVIKEGDTYWGTCRGSKRRKMRRVFGFR